MSRTLWNVLPQSALARPAAVCGSTPPPVIWPKGAAADPSIYRWEFIENNGSVRIEPNGPLTVNDGELMRSLAVQGVGLIYSSTFHTSRELANGTLEPALLDCSPSNDGLFLYFQKLPKNSRNCELLLRCVRRS